MNATLAITVSPPKRISGSKLKNPNRIIYDEDCINIKSIMKYNRIGRYLFFPEFDEKGRLHYHGVVTLDNNQKVRFYKHAQIKLSQIGFLDFKELKTFNDKIRWILYMKKNWYITQRVLEISRPIIKQHGIIKE